MINKKYFLIFVFVFLFLISVVLASSLSSYKYQSIQPGFLNYESKSFQEMCKPGQDFILQIPPQGCVPSIIPSALLEEQDVTVFCPIQAYKVNPLIDVDMIKSISITGKYPPEVGGVGFFPVRAAIDRQVYLDDSFSNNIGYAMIKLRRQRNASKIKKLISGNLTAKILYDIEDSFGAGKTAYYMPLLGNKEWEEKKGQYSFWNKQGYLKIKDIRDDSAEVEVYQKDHKIADVNLKIGEFSNYIYIPGAGCAAGFKIKLDGISSPRIRAKLNINGDILELQKGDRFEQGKCKIEDIEKIGIIQRVKLNCFDDNLGRKKVDLTYLPKVQLKIDGTPKEVEVGEQIYNYKDKGENRYVYLGYLQDRGDQNLHTEFIVLKENKEKLDDSDLKLVARIAESSDYRANAGKETLPHVFGQVVEAVVGLGSRLNSWLVNGETFRGIDEGETKTLWDDKEITFEGLVGPRDFPLDNEVKENYDEAIKNYDLVLSTYFNTKYPDTEENQMTEGEKAFYEKISLMKSVGLRKSARDACEEYASLHKDLPEKLKDVCDKISLSNQESSLQRFFINKKVVDINLLGVYEPSFEDAGAVVYVTKPDGQPQKYKLSLGQIVYLDDKGGFMSLEDVSGNSAKLKISLPKGAFKSAEDYLFNNFETLKLNDEPKNFGSFYSFSLEKVNVKKYAKVVVLPKTNNNFGTADFRFNIAVEKRKIQLSPEKIKRKIEHLDKVIADWKKISDKLDKTVEFFNDACMLTGAYYTLKNFLNNAYFSKGEGIARNKIMNGRGGWNEFCSKPESINKYGSKEQCLLNNSDKIDAQVKKYQEILAEQNNKIKQMQKDKKYIEHSSIFGDNINTELLKKDYVDENYKRKLKENLKKKFGDSINIQGKTIKVEDFVNSLNASKLSMEQIKDLELNSELYFKDSELSKNPELSFDIGGNSFGKGELQYILGQISKEKELEEKQDVLVKETGVSADKMTFVSGSNAKSKPWHGLYLKDVDKNLFDSFKERIPSDTPVEIVHDETGKAYLLELELSGGEYIIKNAYDIKTKEKLDENVRKSKFNFHFEKYDASSYKNEYKNAKLKYYEHGEFKGLPALVPFDLENGWYVLIKNRAGSYDASGKVNVFYLCNVGKNGLEEQMQSDDVCRSFDYNTRQVYSGFPNLDERLTKKKVDEAVDAIIQASKAHKQGARYAIINHKKIEVGEPMLGTPAIDCTDFMSPKDCQVWFNVCDPVLCPPSRCDFGGKYPVENVVQSGIIGSLTLCLPNFEEGIYVPVCLTGVNAGLKSWIAVMQNYQDCLKHNLKTGEVVGVCDEIQSIYLCELFWEQGTFLFNFGKNLFSKKILGEGVHGGGEYLEFSSAFDSARKSADFFTRSYAVGSTKVFNKLTTQDVGTTFCRRFISGSFPNTAQLAGRVGQLDSPVQFYANFEEKSFNTAVNPPISYYSVTYSIYAGENTGGEYQVYLTDEGETSYYQHSRSRIVVATGYLPAGQSITDKKDFTDVSGYRQLCVRFNNVIKCGFKQVTTNFALNYVKDKYVQSQVGNANIKTEEQCLQGTRSAYSLINPNIQAGSENLINPRISEYNIVRVCSTDNPGKGIDEFWNVPSKSRWRKVGYCGSENMGCWLDTQSLEGSFNWASNLNQSLQNVTNSYLSSLKDKFISSKQFKSLIKDIKSHNKTKQGYTQAIEKIDSIFSNPDLLLLDFQKAHLYLLEGNAYSWIARNIYDSKEFPIKKSKQITKPLKSNLKPGDFLYGGDELSAIIFQFEGGKVYYSYWGDEWHVSLDKKKWYNASEFKDLDFSSKKELSPKLFFDDTYPLIFKIDNFYTKYDEKEDKWLFSKFPKNRKNWNWKKIKAEKSDSKNQEGVFASEISKDKEDLILSLSKKQDFKQGIDLIISSLSKGDVNFFDVGNVSFRKEGGKIFSFMSSNTGKGIYFTFEDNEWKWKDPFKNFRFKSVSKVDGFPFSSTLILNQLQGKNFSEGAKVIFKLADAKGELIPSKEGEIISQLNGNDFDFGLELFLKNYILMRKEFSSIKAGNIKFDDKGVFDAFVSGARIKFKFEEGKWYWMPAFLEGEEEWKEVSNTKDISYKIEVGKSMGRDVRGKNSEIATFTLDSNQKNLFKELQGKDFLEGAKIIFDFEKVRGTLRGEENVKAFLEKQNSNDVNGILKDIENEKTCEDCGKDKHWYTFDAGDRCTEEQCLAIGKKLNLECIPKKIGPIVQCITKGKELEDRKGVHYNFKKSRTEAEVIRAIQKTGSVSDSCVNYVHLAVEASKKYDIADPLLLIAVMQQESGCGDLKNTYTADCSGLMQVCSYEMCSSDLGIPNKDFLRKPKNANKNIACGAEILKKYYEKYKHGLTFQGCSNRNVRYYGWEGALRGYNGVGCQTNKQGEKIYSQDYYVENVMNYYNQLANAVS